MSTTLFFTGFPGFLGTELIATLLPKHSGMTALCLVQPKFRSTAEQQIQTLEKRHPGLGSRIRLVEGDITTPGLGIASAALPAEEIAKIEQVFHLAAVYDLSVEKNLAHRINVTGTENMIQFARQCPNLKRFQYVSTCYVSGKHRGAFSEKDLDVGQEFNNFYEETKFLAEVKVREAMQQGLPASIYRPAVVVGNSKTGETQKFDGPYYVMQWLLRQPRIAVLPTIGDGKAHTFNVVPSDFVVEAIAALSQSPNTAGKTFQLADPHALTVKDFVAELGRATHKKIVSIPVPLSLAKFSVNSVPGVGALMRIPASAMNYFVHPTHYECAETQKALQSCGVRTPSFPEYSDRLVKFMVDHPKLRTKAMI